MRAHARVSAVVIYFDESASRITTTGMRFWNVDVERMNTHTILSALMMDPSHDTVHWIF